jgi:hypothetical protein
MFVEQLINEINNFFYPYKWKWLIHLHEWVVFSNCFSKSSTSDGCTLLHLFCTWPLSDPQWAPPNWYFILSKFLACLSFLSIMTHTWYLVPEVNLSQFLILWLCRAWLPPSSVFPLQCVCSVMPTSAVQGSSSWSRLGGACTSALMRTSVYLCMPMSLGYKQRRVYRRAASAADCLFGPRVFLSSNSACPVPCWERILEGMESPQIPNGLPQHTIWRHAQHISPKTIPK